MRSSHPAAMKTASGVEGGQSLTEFLFVAVALVPLFLLVPVIAKYQDIAHATRMASRYAAFDVTTRNDSQGTWKPESQLADEVRRRFFSNSDAPVKTNDVAGDFKANQNLFWRDPKGNPLIKKFSDVRVTFGKGDGTKHDDGFSGASDGQPFNKVPIANAAAMGLPARGIYTVNVAVTLANLPEGIKSIAPFDKINLLIRRHTSVAIDPWTARSPQEAEARFGTLAPHNQMLASSVTQTLVELAIRVVDRAEVAPPSFGRLEVWRDIVPEDRLKPGK